MRILLIEDERALRALFEAVLRDAGHEVDSVEDGLAGLQAAAERLPDLILTDLLTPRMHGYEVIRRLRASHRTRRVPIMVISAQAYAGDQRTALELGASMFLLKPFASEELLQAIDTFARAVRVRFWGVRGSIAAPGAEFSRYGGNTPCVTVEHGGDTLILDAGTGLRKLGLTLQGEADGQPQTIRMLISHTHWDHIQGFPFFTPAYVKGNRLDIYGPPSVEKPLDKVLRGQMDHAYFPVALGELAADIHVHEIREPTFDAGPFRVTCQYVNHPGITMAFRIEIGGVVVTYATDNEPYRHMLTSGGAGPGGEEYGEVRDAALVSFARDSDLYIADSQYTPAEYRQKRGWGHTCYVDAVDVALAANARRLALFSHDPMHEDDVVDQKLEHCKRIAAERSSTLTVLAAIEGAVIEIAPVSAPPSHP